MPTSRPSDLNLKGEGVFVRLEDIERRDLAAAYRKRTKGDGDKAVIAAAEMRLGLEPGAIGKTHVVAAGGHVIDEDGHIVGLTVANPGGIVLARKQQALDFFFGAVAMAAADANLFCGLVTGTYTGGTSDIAILQGTFTGNPEVTTSAWTNYAVVTIANNGTNWSAATGVAGTQVATKANATAISFTANATVTGGGPTPTGWFLANSATLRAAANILATGNLTGGSIAVVNGAAVSFAIGTLTIALT